ncbi:hypothetical protein [Undibacterium sp.]|uniref:hypothetical protein n=1 Tax=Undibacterium sp. TaxID=1914977 RepID=UPI002CD0698C|nr:hypothetical protein [Undibacterium sp.]HTD06946.1 hypothetical protein [Undibacterium sp.]
MKKLLGTIIILSAVIAPAHADESVREKAHEVGRGIKHAAIETGHAIRSGAHKAGHGIKDAAVTVGHKVRDGAHEVAKGTKRAKDKVVNDK